MHFTPATVVYVDESESDRRKTHQRIAKLGYTTLSTSSGAEALAAVQKNSESVALVMIRCGMTQMPGSYLSRAIGVQWPHLPILWVSEVGIASLRAATKATRDQEMFTDDNVIVIPCSDGILQGKILLALGQGAR